MAKRQYGTLVKYGVIGLLAYWIITNLPKFGAAVGDVVEAATQPSRDHRREQENTQQFLSDILPVMQEDRRKITNFQNQHQQDRIESAHASGNIEELYALKVEYEQNIIDFKRWRSEADTKISELNRIIQDSCGVFQFGIPGAVCQRAKGDLASELERRKYYDGMVNLFTSKLGGVENRIWALQNNFVA